MRGAGLDARQRLELLQLEQEVATRYYLQGQRQTWPYVAGTIAGFALWASFLPLTILHILPLPLAFVASCLIATAGWLTAHEAIHDTLGRKGTPRRFWNELTGQLAMVPLMFPLSIARVTHLQHHRHCNDPKRDPDYVDVAESFPKAIWKVWQNRQSGKDGQIHHIRRVLIDEVGTPEALSALKQALITQLCGYLFFIGMALAGYAIEVALVWWLPRWVALVHVHVGFGWDPHHPHTGTSRYDDTSVFKSHFGTILSMGIEGHLVHHLYPNIPIHLTKRALREMRPALEPRGVDYSAL